MKKLRSFILGFLVLMLSLTLVPEIPSYASTGVDLIGDSSLADVGGVRYGVSYQQTGYLCYLLTSSGSNVSGTSAYAFKCPGFNTITAGGYPVFYASSKKGNYVATSWKGTAPWNCSPFNGDQSTNSEQIRAWLKSTNSTGFSNGQSFVKTLWGAECSNKFITGDYILVIETIMHFRYSFDYTFPNLSKAEWRQIINDRYFYMGSQAVEAYTDLYYEEGRTGTKYRIPYGESVIGTVSDCLRYESAMKESFQTSYPFVSICNYNLFRDYLNKVAPFAERIGVGGAGQRAGFRPWTGSVGGHISTSDVYDYGVAMLVISALEDDVVGSDTPLDSSSSSTTYDGTIYTLTSAGGSQSSGGSIGSFAGGSASDTTKLGWGSGDSCAIGSLYAENCATGDEL